VIATSSERGDGATDLAARPSPVPARAWWGDLLLAESARAIRLEERSGAPALYFPCADVRFDRLRLEPRSVTCPVKGTAELWTVDDPAAPSAPEVDRTAVLWQFTDPAPGLEWLADHAAFDHDRIRVELTDGRVGDDPRDITIKRFPNWGDAADLIDVMDVQPVGEHRYVTVARADWRRPVVEASQVLGQAIVAASRDCGDRRVVSAHLVFARVADARLPLELEVDPVADGRTFSSAVVEVTQGGRRCAAVTVLLDETAPDVIRHAVEAPETPGPYASAAYDMSVTGRDLRIVDDAYTGDPDAPVGPPILDTWVRFREVPDDPALHAGLLAQFTGHMSIAAAMRPHPGVGQDDAHRTLSTAINAIAISFHTEPRADRWMLYRHLSTFAGDGMTHSECRVHDLDGALLASFSVDAMVRGFADPSEPVDDRTAL
jgi:acyl-CoA thioesterase-2